MYRPLPEHLTIKNSKIEGLGLFATKSIPQGVVLGLIHWFHNGETIRTPLGAFGNHSDNPSCEKYWDSMDERSGWYLRTKREVQKGEEITWKYTLYKIGDNGN